MKNKIVTKKLCAQPHVKPRAFEPGISSVRSSFILAIDKKWVNGTEIKYMFTEGPEVQRNVVRQAFAHWKKQGIGITFKEVKNEDESIVRIGFNRRLGSWSCVGRDCLDIPLDENTMNFGWDLTADPYGMTTALHEIGHAIGFEHEHQSPFSGISWNSEAVYNEFSGPPNNWDKPTIDSNILTQLPANSLKGSTWDPKSIMEYEFGPGLVIQPVAYRNGIFPPGVLSSNDIKGVKTFYPVTAASKSMTVQLNRAMAIKAKSGGQNDFLFTAPATRKFHFQTAGDLDTVMVISEKAGKETHYMAGDDDSGFQKNAKLTLPLVKGRKYLVNIRVMFAPPEKGGTITVIMK